MVGITTPVATSTDIGESIGGKLFGRNLLNDTTGADAMGLAADVPGTYTLLGRLKAVVEAVLSLAPTRNAFVITPSDTVALATIPRSVRVNAAGTVAYRTIDATADVTITALAGEVIPGRVQYLRATGTSATGFVGYA